MNEAELRAELIDPKLKACDWGIVAGSKILREYSITAGNYKLESGAFHTNVLKNYSKVCTYIKFDIIFASNKTHHASHLNSAPGWVFGFYGGQVL